MARAHGLPLLILLVVAAAIRWPFLGKDPLWFDEGITLVLANLPWSMLWFEAVDPTPPLYYSVVKLVGGGEAVSKVPLRTISLVAGALSVVPVYVLAATVAGRRGACFAAALFCLWSIHVHYATEARAYALTFLLLACGVAAVAVILQRVVASGGDAWRWHLPALAAGCFGLAILAHYSSIFWIAAVVAVVLLYAAVQRNRRRELLLTAVVIVLACGLPLAHMAMVVGEGHSFNWLKQRSFVDAMATVSEVILPLPWTGDGKHFVHGKQMLAAVVAFGLAALLLRWPGGLLRHPVRILALALLLVPLGIYLVGFVKPVLLHRVILPAWLGLAVLLASMVDIRPRVARYAVLTVSAALFAVSLLQMAGESRGRGAPWDKVADYLHDNVSAGDAILVCGRSAYPALRSEYTPVADVDMAVFDVPAGAFLVLEREAGVSWVERFRRYRFQDERPPVSIGLAELRELDRRDTDVWIVRNHCDKDSARMLADWTAMLAAFESRRFGQVLVMSRR